MYVERANGRWEAWTYSDGQRIYIMHAYDYGRVEAYAHKHHFKLVCVA